MRNEIYKQLNISLELTPQIKRTIEKGTQPGNGADSPNPIGFSPRIHDRCQPLTFPRNVKMRDRYSSLMLLEKLVHRLKHVCKAIRMWGYYSALVTKNILSCPKRNLAGKQFDQARNALESIQNPEQEVPDVLQVAKMYSVVMNILEEGGQKGAKSQPDLKQEVFAWLRFEIIRSILNRLIFKAFKNSVANSSGTKGVSKDAYFCA